jgi:hypothetical protein
VSLPRKLGEVYATFTNGSGYINAGSDDRFKDFALRVSLTPLARQHGILQTLTFSPWVYWGDTASKFANSSPDPETGVLGPLGYGLRRDRWGVFAGLRDPRLTIGADYAERIDGGETGDHTAASPVTVHTTTGRVLSAYTIFRPFQLADPASAVPIGVVLRWDEFKPNKSRDANTRFLVAGLTCDLTKRASLALDYQQQLPHDGAATAPVKVYFAHFVVNF